MASTAVLIPTHARNIPIGASASIDALVSQIRAGVESGVRKTGEAARKSAMALVPVRKVFVGGHRGFRTRSVAEAMAEVDAYTKAGFVQSNGRRVTRKQAFAALRGTKLTTTRNRANGWQQSGSQRAVTIETVHFYDSSVGRGRTIQVAHLANPADEFGLTKEGRYQLQGREGSRARPDVHVGPGVFEPNITASGSAAVKQAEIARQRLGGALRDSIAKEDESIVGSLIATSVVAGGSTAPYARFVEFGTRHAAAQPFLQPALKTAEAQFAENLIRELKTVSGVGGRKR